VKSADYEAPCYVIVSSHSLLCLCYLQMSSSVCVLKHTQSLLFPQNFKSPCETTSKIFILCGLHLSRTCANKRFWNVNCQDFSERSLLLI
jgi:hypothetical protein